MKKKLLILLFILTAFIAIFSIPAAWYIVEWTSDGRVFNSTTTVPHNKTGVLLGTARKLQNGRINLYYRYRIDAAVELFRAGKIDYILASGDNSTVYYDEPTTIKKDLVSRGIPENRIYLDYAGFRTLDSIIRSREIFGQEKITIISQEFHTRRAVTIARLHGIDAVGFNARDISGRYGLKVQIRERLARVKMLLDILIRTKPKFLGEKIEIGKDRQ